MFVVFCVLPNRSLCDGLVTRPEESYGLRCVVMCDLETSRIRRPWPALGRSATKKITTNCDFKRGPSEPVHNSGCDPLTKRLDAHDLVTWSSLLVE